jgi:hypothetical protein
VLEENYLPLAPADLLKYLPLSLTCNNVECIKKRAVNVLTREEFELYRQLVYMLAAHRAVSFESFPLVVARVDFVKSPVSTLSIEHAKQFKKRRRVRVVYADLSQLNFAYVPPFERKVLVPTLQATSLRRLLPHRPLEPTTVDPISLRG